MGTSCTNGVGSSGIDLRAARLRLGLSLTQAAHEIGVSKRSLHGAENGTRPHPRNALRIARFYGVDVLVQWPLEERNAA